MRQWPQGLWVVAPDGKVLGFHYHRSRPGEPYAEGQVRWVRETVQMTRDAIAAAGALAPRDRKAAPDPFPDRGKGTNAEGGIRLAVSVTRRDGPPVVDSVFLTREQWAAFRPPAGDVTVGQEWTIPEAAAARFAPAFSPMTDSIFSPKPDDVTVAKVTAKVERVADGLVVIRYAGKWETFHNRDGDPKYPIRTTAVGEGVGVYYTRTKQMAAVAWLMAGTFRNSPPGDQPQRTVSVVDWVAGE